MKLNTNHTHIERGGVKSESTFTIKTNALSFQILSSGLYTDPMMAIIRELSCNAYDAHVEAKNQNTPFEIHLPNSLEPFLSIKDFGTGLSDEDIQGEMIPVVVENNTGGATEKLDDEGNVVYTRSGGLYTTYFDSTKTNSNDYIGALGLGSKSPFSYTDAFEVISRFKGTKRTYAIFLNEEGIPSVALMGEIATDEHSGLEVKIAVKSDDYYTFKNKTETALQYFPVKPKILGVLNFQFKERSKYTIETKEWMLSNGSYYNNSIIAVQGNVAYRVNGEQIVPNLSDDTNKFIKSSNIVIFFAIGELEVAANREEIRYDKKTVDTICKHIEKINLEFADEVQKKIGKVNKKYWYACIELDELSDNIFNDARFISENINQDLIKNKNLKKYIKQDRHVEVERPRGYSLTQYELKGRYRTTDKRLCKAHIFQTLKPLGDTLIVINDVKSGGIKRLKAYLNDGFYNRAIVITKLKTVLDGKIFKSNGEPKKYKGYENELKQITNFLGNPDIELLSEITEVVKKEHVVRDLTSYSFGGLTSISWDYKVIWDKETCAIDKGGLYVPLKFAARFCITNEDGELEEIDFGNGTNTDLALKFLIKIFNKKYDTDYTIDELQGIPVTTYNKIKNRDDWDNLFDLTKDLLLDYVDIIKYTQRLIKTNDKYFFKAVHNNLQFRDNVKLLDNDSVFKMMIFPMIEAYERMDTDVSFQRDTIEILYKIMHSDKKIEVEAFYDETAFHKYSMFNVISDLRYTQEWSILFDYIKLIDRST